MGRKSTLGVLVVLVCAGFVVSALYGQPRPVPVRPPQPPGQFQLSEDQEPLENQRTRVQVEIFQLEGTSEELARLDLDKVAAGTIPEVLARLAENGKAKLMHRVDAPVEFGREMRVTDGNNVPVVRTTVDCSGKISPNAVKYEQTGLSLSVSGSWLKGQDDAKWARIHWDVQWSSVGLAATQPAEAPSTPYNGQFAFNQGAQLRSGDPAMFLASHQPLPGDKDGRSTLGLVRFTVTHLEK